MNRFSENAESPRDILNVNLARRCQGAHYALVLIGKLLRATADANRWNTSLPDGVDVLIFSVIEMKSLP